LAGIEESAPSRGLDERRGGRIYYFAIAPVLGTKRVARLDETQPPTGSS
jgi:hypothetical protein